MSVWDRLARKDLAPAADPFEVVLGERGKLSIRRGRAVPAFGSVTRGVRNGTATLRLKIAAPARRAALRALARGRRVRIRVKVTA